ncbi:MAG: head GIN domain-containing protein [Flavobacteriaceae bacterium]|tara:strand:- start:281 stop:952 length:672 start_codon:yes stop_codon:yes gene_type:complete
MKRLILTLLIIPSLLVSQEEINRNLGEFTKLSIYDGINVELIKSDENKVEASGENTRFVVVKNKNGNLKIRLNVQKRFSGDRTMVKLYYKNLYSFIAHEGSNLFSKDTIKQADLKIKGHTGSRIDIPVELNSISVTSTAGAKITLRGSSTYLEASSATGSEINARNMVIMDGEVSALSGSMVDVRAETSLEAIARIGGVINIHSKTERITEKVSLGGSVIYLY